MIVTVILECEDKRECVAMELIKSACSEEFKGPVKFVAASPERAAAILTALYKVLDIESEARG